MYRKLLKCGGLNTLWGPLVAQRRYLMSPAFKRICVRLFMRAYSQKTQPKHFKGLLPSGVFIRFFFRENVQLR